MAGQCNKSQNKFRPILTSSDYFGQVSTNLDKLRPIFTCLDKFGPIWASLDQFGQVYTNLNKSELMSKKFISASFISEYHAQSLFLFDGDETFKTFCYA